MMMIQIIIIIIIITEPFYDVEFSTPEQIQMSVYRNHHFPFMAQVPWVEEDVPTCSSKCIQKKKKEDIFLLTVLTRLLN